MTSFAGEWRQDSVGYWWRNDDGSYPASSWQWLDGNRDGVAECYYFGPDGYMAANTEIDGYQVNSDGAWVANGVVQKKTEAGTVDKTQENKRAKEAYKKVLEGENINGYFCLLDINQDGVEEMISSSWQTVIYAYQNGQVMEIGTTRDEGRIYDKKNKRLIINYAHYGIENRIAYFYDGTQWIEDSANWYNDHWGDFSRHLLSYDAFYQEMRIERASVYKDITDKESEYQSYKDSWEEWNAFIEKYGDWEDIEHDDRDTENVENTPANREALLR